MNTEATLEHCTDLAPARSAVQRHPTVVIGNVDRHAVSQEKLSHVHVATTSGDVKL